MIDFSKFGSLFSVISHFDTEEACKRVIEETKWKDGVVCPKCGGINCSRRADGRFRCNGCKHNFSCLTGTIFENTKLPLRKWFMAMYLISSHKKGISSHQLARDLNITQKSAWFILMKVRSTYTEDTKMLENEVECDETYIGGREQNKHEWKKVPGTQGRSLKTKTPVFGIIERGTGTVVAKVVENNQGKTLSPIIRQFVKPGSRIFTDEFVGYKTLTDSEYTHAVVHHNAKEFVVGDIYTNGIEGFWGHFKRMIFGVYHFCSAAHLQQYVNEEVFRWNTRNLSSSERFKDMFSHSLHIITQADIAKIHRYHKKAA